MGVYRSIDANGKIGGAKGETATKVPTGGKSEIDAALERDRADGILEHEQDLAEAANANKENKFNDYNPWGQTEWTVDANGRPVRTTSLNPADQTNLDSWRGLNSSVQGFAKDLMGNPIKGPDSADNYRQSAENAFFNRASARLDPMWQKRTSQSNTQLLNMGLDPSSEAYKNSMGDLNMARNDAYSSAMNDAQIFGGQEAQRNFGMDLNGAQFQSGQRIANGTFGLNALNSTKPMMPTPPPVNGAIMAPVGSAIPKPPPAEPSIRQRAGH